MIMIALMLTESCFGVRGDLLYGDCETVGSGLGDMIERKERTVMQCRKEAM